MSSRLLFKTERHEETPLMLVESVRLGKNVGIPTNTPDDYLCVRCLADSVFSSPFVDAAGVSTCTIHGGSVGLVHKSKLSEYRDAYEQELSERLRREKGMSEDRAPYGLVKYQSPLEIPAENKALMVKDIMKAGLITRDAYGPYAEQAAECAAVIALLHGLNPFVKEVSAWPISRNVKNDKGKWEQQVTGFAIHVGYKAYLRVANEEAKRQDNPFFLGKAITLDAIDVEKRGANICSACAGTGKFGKGDNQYPCKRCSGKGKFAAQDVIVVLQPIYLVNEAKLATSVGMKPEPRFGEGVWQPGDQIPNTRSAWWQAWKRAFTDCFRQAYSLDFSLPPMQRSDGEAYRPEVVVLSPDEYGTAPAPVVVEEMPEPEQPEAELDIVGISGIEIEVTQDEFDAFVERMIAAGFDERANVINTMVALGIDSYRPDNKETVEHDLLEFLKEGEEEPTDMDEGFAAMPSGKDRYTAQKTLEENGYAIVAQKGLFKSLFGEGLELGNVNSGQLHNAVEYAKLAHVAKTTSEVGSPAIPAIKEIGFAGVDAGVYDLETFKDTLKELVRGATKKGKFINLGVE